MFGDTNLKNNIITELAEFYSGNKNQKRNLVEKPDSNNHLIYFDIDVYDSKKFEFREGKLDDFVALSVG